MLSNRLLPELFASYSLFSACSFSPVRPWVLNHSVELYATTWDTSHRSGNCWRVLCNTEVRQESTKLFQWQCSTHSHSGFSAWQLYTTCSATEDGLKCVLKMKQLNCEHCLCVLQHQAKRECDQMVWMAESSFHHSPPPIPLVLSLLTDTHHQTLCYVLLSVVVTSHVNCISPQ